MPASLAARFRIDVAPMVTSTKYGLSFTAGGKRGAMALRVAHDVLQALQLRT